MCACVYIVEAKKKTSLEALIDARGKVKIEIQDLKEKLKMAKENIATLKDAVANIQRDGFSSLTKIKTEPTPGTSKGLM